MEDEDLDVPIELDPETDEGEEIKPLGTDDEEETGGGGFEEEF